LKRVREFRNDRKSSVDRVIHRRAHWTAGVAAAGRDYAEAQDGGSPSPCSGRVDRHDWSSIC
jgi:hypothetical protein